jgi:pimeloyl-ACP methyl ester carboxylesterase
LSADDWVQRMIDSPGRPGQLKTGSDAVTHYLEWGETSNPRVLLLLHGFLGHAHWWDFVAPFFAMHYRVIAMDFGGMGDSSPRPTYSNAGCLSEVGAVLKMLGSRTVTLIGHSFGGRITVLAANEFPECLQRAIVVDTKIGFPDRPARPRFRPGGKRVYPDLASIREHFRFVPEEPPVLPRIMGHLALHSVKRQSDGFVWKFDPALRERIDWGSEIDGDVLAALDLPVDFIAGEFSSVVPKDLANRIGKVLRHGRGPVIIPSAYHHIPVDQPLGLVSALRALLI